jgi:hypothetical protein
MIARPCLQRSLPTNEPCRSDDLGQTRAEQLLSKNSPVRQHAVRRDLEHCLTSVHWLAVDLSNDIAAYASELCRIVWERGRTRKPPEK